MERFDSPGSMGADWSALSVAHLDEVVRLRRAIHADPELGLRCDRTTAKIKAALSGLPLEYREGPSSSGLIALLRGGRADGRTVLLRGDMDALPIQEQTGLPYASKTDGAMHACGHDAHTAMLFGAASLLCAKRSTLAGDVVFMFQPGEEGFHGARHMMDDGLLADPKPDAAFALHVAPTIAGSVLSARAGPMLASHDVLSVTVRGKGGHAAEPHDACDPIPVACEIVTALQTFVSRRISVFEPTVLSITKIDAGTTFNVIPETAQLLGTLRTLSEDARAHAVAGFKRIVEHVAAAHHMTAEAHVEPGFPVTMNDPQAVQLFKHAAMALGSDAGWTPMPQPDMGAEDFSYVLREIPGAMAYLGVALDGADPKANFPLHHPRMTSDEAALAKGVAILCAVAERFLEHGFPTSTD